VTSVQAFVHEATLSLGPGSDPAAPGGAVTQALCGDREHDGRCRWPHHSGLRHIQGADLLRTVVVCDPAEEPLIRNKIDTQLAIGSLTGPDGRASSWQLRDTHPADPDPDEATLAARLAAG